MVLNYPECLNIMIDSHIHLQEYIRPEDLSFYLEELGRQDVSELLCVPYDIESSQKAVELLKAYERIRETANARTFEKDLAADKKNLFEDLSVPQKNNFNALHIAAGIHPQYIADDPDSQIAELRTILNDNKNISAIGEIGLDYRKDMPDREMQKLFFRKQLEMSLEYSLPVSIHSVSACEDTLTILKDHSGVKGIMHGYAYSAEAAKEFVKLGFKLGVGTTLLNPSAKKLPEVVRSIPQEYLVTETDFPFSYKKSSPAWGGETALECEYFTPETIKETAKLHAKMLRNLLNLL